MKKILFSFVMLTAPVFIHARTKIDSIVQLDNATYKETFDYEGIADAFRRFTYEKGIVIEIDTLEETEEGIIVELKIFKAAADENYQGPTSTMELLSKPIIKIGWDKIGRIEIAQESADRNEITSRLIVELIATKI
jgi:hypothetical protein